MQPNEIILIKQPEGNQALALTVREGAKLIGHRVHAAIVGPDVSDDYIRAELMPRMAPQGRIIRAASVEDLNSLAQSHMIEAYSPLNGQFVKEIPST